GSCRSAGSRPWTPPAGRCSSCSGSPRSGSAPPRTPGRPASSSCGRRWPRRWRTTSACGRTRSGTRRRERAGVSERTGTQGLLAPPPPGHRRLDPRTLVTRVVTLSALRQYWGALLPLLAVLGVNGGFRSGGLAAVLAAVIVVALVGALVEWLRTWYGVHDGRLVVERGVLRRSLTVVPVDRIRGVDVHASALQRLLGIVSVRVDAAAT